ncbi:DUF202 domain-containing protein [Gordonia sp. (in: high G+C Gram-positive bacteria)]|uniref:YidH family protein n=1 Tax=Gordonia sp. (in: high G+C Gram-positive bacteria) TaxID=84139 RepID=UPI002621F037|nr:DUF202 domain-containing protein [Gordonia sp. (in: high G+C Gram-positive bacteria)]
MTNRVEGSGAPTDDDPDSAGALVPGAVDARFTLASERTVLAWLRTALGLMAAGVAVLHLIDPFGNAAARVTLGSALVVIGALTAVIGIARWRMVDAALKRGGPLPGPWPIYLLAALLVLTGLGFVVWH